VRTDDAHSDARVRAWRLTRPGGRARGYVVGEAGAAKANANADAKAQVAAEAAAEHVDAVAMATVDGDDADEAAAAEPAAEVDVVATTTVVTGPAEGSGVTTYAAHPAPSLCQRPSAEH